VGVHDTQVPLHKPQQAPHIGRVMSLSPSSRTISACWAIRAAASAMCRSAVAKSWRCFDKAAIAQRRTGYVDRAATAVLWSAAFVLHWEWFG
jgi:hypothetical protein